MQPIYPIWTNKEYCFSYSFGVFPLTSYLVCRFTYNNNQWVGKNQQKIYRAMKVGVFMVPSGLYSV